MTHEQTGSHPEHNEPSKGATYAEFSYTVDGWERMSPDLPPDEWFSGEPVSFVLASDYERLRSQVEQLAKALDECATRFERCCIHSGSDKEFAAHAVEDYRALVAAALPERAP
jgi:hypothetical protein